LADYIALGTLGLNILLVLSAIYLNMGLNSIVISLIILFIGIYLHIPNIQRILNKTEKGLRDVLKKKAQNI
jgi:glycerol-3-phosphate acyltransferase PlsY